MYELTVRGGFAAAHQLRGYRGKCEGLHGHNWKVAVTVRTAELDARGLAMDFTDIKAALGRILEELDHRFLNDLPAFSRENPSSERIARWIFERVEEELPAGSVEAARVTVWESDEASATYFHEA